MTLDRWTFVTTRFQRGRQFQPPIQPPANSLFLRVKRVTPVADQRRDASL